MTDAAPAPIARSNQHRRRASSLYGLIIAGSVLATSGTEERLIAVAAALVATLGVYWAAETYVHLMAERGVERHVLDAHTIHPLELSGLIRDFVNDRPALTSEGAELERGCAISPIAVMTSTR